MRGLRVHISGSASTVCDGNLLSLAHGFVRSLVSELIRRGGGLVLGIGGEPLGSGGHPCIFDWTALEIVAATENPGSEWPPNRRERFVVVASQRGLEKVPETRTVVWDKCRRRTDFQFESTPAGWRMAGVIRERQVCRGDLLLAVGGGAGVEHLAAMYRDDGKPVIPIHVEIGALCNDGNGGSRFLHERALADVGAFIRLRDEAGSAAARLLSLRLTASTNVETLAEETVSLIADLRPRPAFYVRLLAADHPDFASVERFFREVVDVVVVERGFTAREMGRSQPEVAFMNVEIFEAIHRAGLVAVDLTGVRPNCMMELGYAFGRRRRVVISAKKGTALPFDSDKLPVFTWNDADSPADRIAQYQEWLDRFGDLPPIVV